MTSRTPLPEWNFAILPPHTPGYELPQYDDNVRVVRYISSADLYMAHKRDNVEIDCRPGGSGMACAKRPTALRSRLSGYSHIPTYLRRPLSDLIPHREVDPSGALGFPHLRKFSASSSPYHSTVGG